MFHYDTFLHTGYSGISFLVTFDDFTLTPEDPIVFNYPVINTGGHYDPTTGIYTVPIDGTYEFIFRFRANNDAGLGAWLVVDGDDVSLFSIMLRFERLHLVIINKKPSTTFGKNKITDNPKTEAKINYFCRLYQNFMYKNV